MLNQLNRKIDNQKSNYEFMKMRAEKQETVITKMMEVQEQNNRFVMSDILIIMENGK